MAAPIVVRFVVEGVDQVQQAFRKVEDAVVRGEKAGTDAAMRGSRIRLSEADREARDKARLADREAREKIAAAKAADKVISDALKATTKEAEKAAKESVRIEERASKEKARIAEAAGRDRERAMQVLARQVEKYSRDEVRATERAEAEKTRIAEQASRTRSRFASTVAGAAIGGARAGLSRVGGMTSGIASTALSLGGGFSIADSLQETMSLQRNAALLSNSGYQPGKNKRVDPAVIAAKARAIAVETGIDANEIVEGTRTYVKRSSDLEGGLKNAKFFAKLSKSTGSDYGDVMNTAGRLRAQNPELTAEGTQSMMMGIVAAGKMGSLEMSDMGANAGKMTKTRVAYAGDMAKNQATLLGLGQIAARSGGGAEDAATVVSNLGDDALKHQSKIKGSRDEKTGKLVAPEELIAKVFEQSGGDLGKIQGMGFGKRSMKLFEEMKVAYDRGGGDVGKGVQAVRDEMAPVTNAKYDQKSLNEDFKAVMDTPAEQFANALRMLKEEVGAQLLPEFVKLVPVIKDMIPLFVDVAKTSLPAFLDLIKSLAEFANANRGIIHDIAAHPIGALLAKEVMSSIASAGLGAAMRTSIGQSIGGAGIAIGSAVLMVQQLAAADDKVVSEGNDALSASANARGELRVAAEDGTLTREQIDDKKKTAAALLKNIQEQEDNKGGGGLRIAGIVGAGIADGATLGFAGAGKKVNEAHKDRVAADEKQIAALKAELATLTKSIQEADRAFANAAATQAAAARTVPLSGKERGGAGGN